MRRYLLPLLFAITFAVPLFAYPPPQQYNTSSSCSAASAQCCTCAETDQEGYYGYRCARLLYPMPGDEPTHGGNYGCQAYQLPNNVYGPVGCTLSGGSCTGVWQVKNGNDTTDYRSLADAVEGFMIRWDVGDQTTLSNLVAKLDEECPETRYEALRAHWNASVPYWQLGHGQFPYRPEPKRPTLADGTAASAAPQKPFGPTE